MSTTDTAAPRTLAEKVWDDHLVRRGEAGRPDLLYIDPVSYTHLTLPTNREV